ncbi:MAG: hypothetical protein AAFX89_00095 [Pseudomonadota bacterium]
MDTTLLRGLGASILAFSLAACGGGGGGGDGGGGSLPTEPTDPPDEVPDAVGAPDLSDRTVNGEFDMVALVIDDGSITSGDVTFEASTGVVTGFLLGGTDLDSAVYTNPANGEFSRIARISGDNVFGAIGLEASDLPAAGTVTNYNEGWVGMTAIFEDNVFVLTGDSEFTVTWGDNDIDGRFFNLSGTSDIDGNVTNVGTIILTNGNVGATNSRAVPLPARVFLMRWAGQARPERWMVRSLALRRTSWAVSLTSMILLMTFRCPAPFRQIDHL